MARDGNGRRVLSDDERVLWTIVTKTIAPLREPALNPDEESPDKAAPAARRPLARKAAEPAAPRQEAPAVSPPSALGRRKRSRVARGREAIDGRLDLHGLTQSEAHATLLRFLRNASARQARLVLVITGKGSGKDGDPGGRGVLRRQLPQWLALPEFRALVIGFEQAHIAHGGEGAWYISVRRSRTAE
jgi:DNA-nicking Smr family endonuclease